ncbi:hypothetical protein FGO68_gene11581 [Halteria grandinella]|uniref:Uncharacterized protein n=1 Tax=Halteria grandinella TaxID=5974 RepID=A0A8J8NZ73_HALGN|nr:hypothetical protein FGO68_gene11581 [Halteria grandinella]
MQIDHHGVLSVHSFEFKNFGQNFVFRQVIQCQRFLYDFRVFSSNLASKFLVFQSISMLILSRLQRSLQIQRRL